MKIETAEDRGVATLYHYQGYDPAKLRQVVAEWRLFMPKPSMFNDPWDCRPYYKVPPLADPKEFEKHLQWFLNACRAMGQPEAKLRVHEQIARMDPDTFRKIVEKTAVDLGDSPNDEYRLYCMSARPDQELMWAHYGDSHRGICLEYSARNDPFSTALRVHYSAGYPEHDMTDGSLEANLKVFVSKPASWTYEEEYRLVAQERKFAVARDVLICEDHWLVIPDDALKAIILGCKAPPGMRAEIEAMIASTGRPIAVRTAEQMRDRYMLEIK